MSEAPRHVRAQDDDQLDRAEPPDALVVADDLSLRTRAGAVFGPLTLRLAAGRPALLVGPAGSGRSALLLALTGRMRGVSGRLRVGGVNAIADSHTVRQRTSVARIADLIDLEPQLTVAESLTERSLTDAVSTATARARFAERCALAGLDLEPDRLIERLPAVERTLLAVVLAALRPSELIALDDVDLRLSAPDLDRVLDGLVRLCPSDSMIIATAVDRPPRTDLQVVDLTAAGRGHRTPQEP